MNDLRIEIDGRIFSGWIDVSVQRSMETLADSFSVSYTDRWLPAGVSEQIVPGQKCKLYIDDELILDGYIDSSDVSYDKASHTLSASGRSKVADLVDCSVIRKGGPWINSSLATIASDLCDPFGVNVIDAAASLTPIPRFAIEPGETVFEAISRLCKVQGVLPIASLDTLVFTRTTGTDRTKTVLRYGENILQAKRARDFKDRFSEYTFFSQTGRVGDVYTENTANSWTRRILDDEVGRYRPFRVWCEIAADKSALAKRSIWERNVRRGRSDTLEIRVQGWKNAEGLAWSPNFRLTIDDPVLDVSGEWLITSASLIKSSEGTIADLTLLRPEAFSVEVPIPKRKKKPRKKPRP